MDEVKQHEGINLPQAFEHTVNGALANLPQGSSVVGIQVILAYVSPTMDPQAVEACGSAIARTGYDMRDLARLFALYAKARQDGWAQDVQNGRTASLVGRPPRRRPRR